MSRQCDILRVFTREQDGGNFLGVVTDIAGLTTETMQAIAADLGFPETIFCDLGGDVPIARIFTPQNEMPFAVHPLVGLAWALADLTPEPVTQVQCQVGSVSVWQEGGQSWIRAAGGQPVEVMESAPLEGEEAVMVSMPLAYLLVRLTSARLVADLVPPPASMGEVYAWAWEEPAKVVKARFFAAELGVPEDPATGSAAVAR